VGRGNADVNRKTCGGRGKKASVASVNEPRTGGDEGDGALQASSLSSIASTAKVAATFMDSRRLAANVFSDSYVSVSVPGLMIFRS